MELTKVQNVFIHDGVRPVISRKNFLDLYAALESEKSQGAVLYLPISDSLIEFRQSFHENTYLDRSKIISLQTPHLYRVSELWDCFSQYQGEEMENAQLMEHCGKKLSYVLGSRENIKLTFPHDITVFKKMLSI
jgi:2-C-methyl-D-erythritol 4-phosphate cytidylyltransferase